MSLAGEDTYLILADGVIRATLGNEEMQVVPIQMVDTVMYSIKCGDFPK